MSDRETVTLLLHGANQAFEDEEDTVPRDAEDNAQTWEDALDVESRSKKIRQLLTGEYQEEVDRHHQHNHANRLYPKFSGYRCPWYGDVYGEVRNQLDGVRLNPSEGIESLDKEQAGLMGKIEEIQREKMKKHFDELVPFYELAVTDKDNRTLYELVCERLLKEIADLTSQGKDYIIIAHSMGCAVSYNVLSHLSCCSAGSEYCAIDGALSDDYRALVKQVVDSDSRCFGLATFGNYTAYNWCQKLNNQILYGEPVKQFVYPQSAAKWFNFWTTLGGDPYILDDQLEETFVDDEEDRFSDVAVRRIPLLSPIGHGRKTWFSRNGFSKQVFEKLAWHLYC